MSKKPKLRPNGGMELPAYSDPLMLQMAVGTLPGIKLNGLAPDTAKGWYEAFVGSSHGREPEAYFAHAIAAGMLVPVFDKMHLAPGYQEWLDAVPTLGELNNANKASKASQVG